MNKKAFFVSYSHEDDEYFRIFMKGLKSHSSNSKTFNWDIWEDRELAIGEDWLQSIKTQINNCDFGILLVSSDFLNSKFIKEHELGTFIDRYKKEEDFVFFPVLLRPCNFSNHKDLSEIQFFPAYSKDYGFPERGRELITYADLVPNSKKHNPDRDRYHINLIKAIEKTIETKLSKKKAR